MRYVEKLSERNLVGTAVVSAVIALALVGASHHEKISANCSPGAPVEQPKDQDGHSLLPNMVFGSCGGNVSFSNGGQIMKFPAGSAGTGYWEGDAEQNRIELQIKPTKGLQAAMYLKYKNDPSWRKVKTQTNFLYGEAPKGVSLSQWRLVVDHPQGEAKVTVDEPRVKYSVPSE